MPFSHHVTAETHIHTKRWLVAVSFSSQGRLKVYSSDGSVQAEEQIAEDATANDILDAIVRLCVEVRS